MTIELSIPHKLSRNFYFITTLFAFAFVIAILAFLPQSYALNPCSDNPCPVGADDNFTMGTTNTLVFRDINSLDNSSATISIDGNKFGIGNTATVTVNDFNANVDIGNLDNIYATAISSSGSSTKFNLTETGIDTGVFVGNLGFTNGPSSGNLLHTQKGDHLSIAYATRNATARFKAELDDVTASGTAQISDFIITDPNFVTNNCFIPVVQPINFTLVGGPVGPSGYTVTMSYADALLEPPVPPQDTQLLQMYYKPVGGSWSLVTFNAFGDPGANNPDAMTITSDPTFFGNPALTNSGLFTIGFDTGCGGGAGGGLVASGLVLDVLAGIGGSNYGVIAPPSFGGGSNHFDDGLTLVQGTNKTTFDISKYNQEIPKQVLISGDKVNMTFKTFESYSVEGVVHMGLYLIPRGSEDMITTNSIASIVYEKGSPVEVNDPNHILSNTYASTTSSGKYQYTTFSFTPTKSYDKMSFLVRAWNDHMYSTDTRIYDAVELVETAKTLPLGVVMYTSFNELEATLEKEGFYKPGIMAHIHDTDAVFSGSGAGTVYWLYDTINHTVTMVVADTSDNELASSQATLQPYKIETKGDYKFMYFTEDQLNRWDVDQEQRTMGIESAKAMFMAAEHGLLGHRNW